VPSRASSTTSSPFTTTNQYPNLPSYHLTASLHHHPKP
jgi:hypothetical protein